MKEMRLILALWAGLSLSIFAQQQDDKTADAAPKEAPQKKGEESGAQTVSGGVANSKGNKPIQQAVVPSPEEEPTPSAIQSDDSAPDVGMFVAMANRGWDAINSVSAKPSVASEAFQAKGAAPTFSNNMMDSPDGSQRANDGWKLFGWTY